MRDGGQEFLPLLAVPGMGCVGEKGREEGGLYREMATGTG